MKATETSDASKAVEPAPVRAPAWPAAMGAASLAVAATYLGKQIWEVWYSRSLSDEPEALDSALRYAQHAPNALLVLAALLLLWRKRAGCWLHIAYAIASITVIGCVVAKEMLVTGAGAGGPGGLPMGTGALLIQATYPLLVLVWFARPKIMRQLGDLDLLTASHRSPERGFRHSNRIWPSAVGAASITFGLLHFAWFLSSTGQSFYYMSANNPYLRLKWFWLHWLGRIDIPSFCLVLMPGAFAVSLTLAGIGLLRRWWAAIPLHAVVAIMMPTCMLCIWFGMPWGKMPVYFWSVNGAGQIVIRLLAMPMFSGYPLFLMVWFCWPGMRKKTAVWYRIARRRNRQRGLIGQGLAAAARAAVFAAIIALPIMVAGWRCWPKPPPGIDFFGQAISLPKSNQGIPPSTNRMATTIVCVGAHGSLYIDGRNQPSLKALRQAIATAKRTTPTTQLRLAIDERTPFSLAWPVLDMYRSALPRGQGIMLLLVKSEESDSDWMDEMSGCVLVVRLLSSASAWTVTSPKLQASIRILADGKIILNGQLVAFSDLCDQLSPYGPSEATRNLKVIITADDEAPFGSVVNVLNASKRVGIDTFAFPIAAETQPAPTKL